MGSGLQVDGDRPRNYVCEAANDALPFGVHGHVALRDYVQRDVAKTQVSIGIPVDKTLCGTHEHQSRRRSVDARPTDDHFLIQGTAGCCRLFGGNPPAQCNESPARSVSVPILGQDNPRRR